MASAASMTPSAAIEFLAQQRRRPERLSLQTVQAAETLLRAAQLETMGDEMWPFLEQVAIAALDCGRRELAELCTSRLNTRFPDSARVASLQGMLLEASQEYEKALAFYDAELKKDEGNLIIVKRRIAVLKSMEGTTARGGGIQEAIKALTAYVDTYYADAEAWAELAALYSEVHMYPQAIFALEEQILLQPQSGFAVLQLAETQYTAARYEEACTSYLRVLEMAHVEEGVRKTGPWMRAVWGLKMTTSKLLSSGVVRDAATTQRLDALATELLSSRVYGGAGAPAHTRKAALAVLSAAR
ncbi:TPR-like protein [Tilletiopsis washingtonensis]|uniref:ER membrane protein complex subunit 2 n=1 Tax=Tilletiopsis washingtonensis TaxID=58919 RepID=A0A316Z8V6_9BASI|nr:TPR-like protein [Tilletiopsis washingtonensis]PWN97418.1 TPR-like protein [Tilletiopsis washingtonensis]